MMVHSETVKVPPDGLKIENILPHPPLSSFTCCRASIRAAKCTQHDHDCACMLGTFAACFTCFPSNMVGNIMPRPFETSKAARLL